MGASDLVHSLEELTGARLLRLDELCDRFESAWRRGERPCLESYVRELPQADRLVAARELIRVEVEYRVGRGEVPLAREYEEAIPLSTPPGSSRSSRPNWSSLARTGRRELRQRHAPSGLRPELSTLPDR